jgi:colicin import membrane protein
MKRTACSALAHVLAALCLAAGSPWASSQEPEQLAEARARIAADRSQVEARFAAEEKACYGKFAVNDCLSEAQKRRREATADLRRQENILTETQRKRRSAERLRELEQRSAEQKESAAQHASKALAEQKEREKRAAEKAAAQHGPEQAGTAQAMQGQPSAGGRGKARQKEKTVILRKPPDTAARLKQHQEHLEDAQEHREQLAKRLAQRKKPPGKPLPVPP